jgi:folylpolyglutamate synthase
MRPSLVSLLSRMTGGTSTRSYAQAIDALNGLQSNAAVIDAIRKSGGKGGDVQLKEQLEYMQRIGYSVRSPLGMS